MVDNQFYRLRSGELRQRHGRLQELTHVGHRKQGQHVGFVLDEQLGVWLKALHPVEAGLGVVVYKAEKEDGAYVFHMHWVFEGAESDLSAGGAVAVGYGRGVHQTTCAYGETGVRQAFPDGVDLVFSINTNDDKQCAEVKDCDRYLVTLRDNMLAYGVCRVNWAEVITTPPLE